LDEIGLAGVHHRDRPSHDRSAIWAEL